ncbi:hypothetical protein LSH36_648g01058 [Paralvinella palmiformis]|uniref:Uncharacterized protein n=1 Tax=Paralvinella palmiformis TaxID=53620 RepID=A0AAD9J3F3_9ANNE|nr:hypothetical protein LSH36_648g01058 [Paralvinella palmiformis]
MVNASTSSDVTDRTPVSTPMRSPPDSFRSTSRSPSHVRISYRSEDEIASSVEDLARKMHEENQNELRTIEREWNESIKNWPEIVLSHDPNTSSEPTDTSTDNVNVERVNEIVQEMFTYL